MNSLFLVAYGILIVLPVLWWLPDIPRRIRDLRRGIRGVIYVPVCIGTLIVTAIASFELAEYFPVLWWGWLGRNILLEPLIATTAPPVSAGGSSPDPGLALLDILQLVIIVAFLLLALLLANYREEDDFRDTWKHVALWGGLHLLMGIPILAVIPITATGSVYKLLHDRYGLEVAYTAHFGTNIVLLGGFLTLLVAL